MNFRTSSSAPRTAQVQTKCPDHRNKTATGLRRNYTGNHHIKMANDQKMKEFIGELMKSDVLEIIGSIGSEDSKRMKNLNNKLDRITTKIDAMNDNNDKSEIAEMKSIVTDLKEQVERMEKRSLRQTRQIMDLRSQIEGETD